MQKRGEKRMSTMVETVRHKKKESTLKWFIIAIIPVVNLYFLWRTAEIISAHELTNELQPETTV